MEGKYIHVLRNSELAALIPWHSLWSHTRQNKDNYLFHIWLSIFASRLSTEWMWLLCLCQDAVTESTSSSLHGKGLIIGHLLADSFWKGQEIIFCDTQPGLTCFQTAQFLKKQSNLIHCITLAIQKARARYQSVRMFTKDAVDKAIASTVNRAKRAEGILIFTPIFKLVLCLVAQLCILLFDSILRKVSDNVGEKPRCEVWEVVHFTDGD